MMFCIILYVILYANRSNSKMIYKMVKIIKEIIISNYRVYSLTQKKSFSLTTSVVLVNL